MKTLKKIDLINVYAGSQYSQCSSNIFYKNGFLAILDSLVYFSYFSIGVLIGYEVVLRYEEDSEKKE